MKYFSYCSSAWSVASKFSNVYKSRKAREATSEGAKIRISLFILIRWLMGIYRVFGDYVLLTLIVCSLVYLILFGLVKSNLAKISF